jgi:transposase
MAMADRHGLPVAIGIASGERHEAPLVVDTIRARFVKALPERLIGDKAYDSDPLDAELGRMGIDMIAPNKSHRRCKTQDLRKLRRDRHRWRIERGFAWLMRFRRLITRFEHHANNFLGFCKLGCLVILLRHI